MNSSTLISRLLNFGTVTGKQQLKILLFPDNAPVHPSDIKLENITVTFSPSNTVARIQSMDQDVIHTFKDHYCRRCYYSVYFLDPFRMEANHCSNFTE